MAGVDAGISRAPDHPNLAVTKLFGAPKRRHVYWVNSLSTNTTYKVHNSNINACVRAMKERLLFVCKSGEFIPTEKPTTSFSAACSQFFIAFSKLAYPASPLTKEQFLGACKGRKRVVYERAFESLLSKEFRNKDSFIQFFIKCEKINFSKKLDPAPRGISPRNPRYHVMLGPYIKRIEKKIYKTIGKLFGAPTVFKCLNAQDRGKQLREHWDHFDDPVAIGLDASRFDQHVSKEALIFEHKFYKLFFPNDSLFSRLLSLQTENTLFANCPDGRARLQLSGGRMSGDMNTALGNCLLMSCMVWSYLSSRVSKFRLANDGDDCVVFIEKKDLRKLSDLSEWFLSLGFDMKVEDPVDVFERIEFCQSQPVWTPSGWLMVRKVPESIAKDSMSIKPLDNPKVFRRWMSSVGKAGLALAGGIPIVQEVYHKFDEVGDGSEPLFGDPTMETGLMIKGRGMKREYSTVHPLTRVSFWRAFGIPVMRQIALEDQVRAIDPDCIPRFSNVAQHWLHL